MRKRCAVALIRRSGWRKCMTRGVSLLLCFVVVASMISSGSVAHAGIFDSSSSSWWGQVVSNWIDNSSSTANTWNTVDNSNHSYTVNKPQNYYTSVTSSVVDKSGNVTNYYRGGDTTNTKIIDSYNRTFNTIHNTTNNCITTWFGSAWLLKVICNTLASGITLVTSRELVRPVALALFRC